jgi:hypothetical protein
LNKSWPSIICLRFSYVSFISFLIIIF